VPDVLTVVTAPLDELQLPPATLALRAVEALIHTEPEPLIVPASAVELTVIDFVAVALPQLLVTLYDIVAIPAPTPVTVPVALTVATAPLDELQLPAATLALRAVEALIHTEPEPLIVPASAVGLTVIDFVAVAVPQLLLTL
jgi:hypothetical protein